MRPLVRRRPLAVLDLEPTGTSRERDRSAALAVLVVQPDGTRRAAVARVSPGVPIPAGATAVHGIADRDVAACPPFRDLAPALAAALASCDLAGAGLLAFDLPLLLAEFRRAGVDFDPSGCAAVDPMVIFHAREPGFPTARTLGAALNFSCGRTGSTPTAASSGGTARRCSPSGSTQAGGSATWPAPTPAPWTGCWGRTSPRR